MSPGASARLDEGAASVVVPLRAAPVEAPTPRESLEALARAEGLRGRRQHRLAGALAMFTLAAADPSGRAGRRLAVARAAALLDLAAAIVRGLGGP